MLFPLNGAGLWGPPVAMSENGAEAGPPQVLVPWGCSGKEGTSSGRS